MILRWSIFGVVVFLLALGFSQDANEALSEDEERLQELGLQLELGLLKLEKNLDDQGASGTERRNALARHLEANAQLIAEQRQLHSQLNAPPPAPLVAAEVPGLAGKTDQQIADSLSDYLSHEMARLRGNPESEADYDQAHIRIGNWLEQADIEALRNAQKEANGRLRKAEEDALWQQAVPYTVEELGAFSDADRTEAKIYNITIGVMQQPLREGESIRDRYASVEQELAPLRAQQREEQINARLNQRNLRIAELEQALK